jgi:hypothetical protein
MKIFRNDIDASHQQSPIRRVFGRDPNTNKILVPIDVCLLALQSGSPVLDINLPSISSGADILESPRNNRIGKVALVSTPSFGSSVDPIVTLDSSSTDLSSVPIPVIDSVDITKIKAGDQVLIRLEDNTIVSGKIVASIVGLNSGSDLLQDQVFPLLGAGFTVQAIRVDFSQPVGESLQGLPIFMAASNKVLGMLMGVGTSILAYHI